ncbi:MAG: hypothetical protein AB7O67_00630 [Vicinamibacterales bacterium]
MVRGTEVWKNGRLARPAEGEVSALCREVERVVRSHGAGQRVRSVVLLFDEPEPAGPAVTVDVFDSGFAERDREA